MLKFRPTKESNIKEEKVNKHDSGTYNVTISSTDAKILAAIKALENLNCS